MTDDLEWPLTMKMARRARGSWSRASQQLHSSSQRSEWCDLRGEHQPMRALALAARSAFGAHSLRRTV